MASSPLLGKDPLPGQAPVIANPGIETGSVSGGEPMSLLEKHSYGKKNPELVYVAI